MKDMQTNFKLKQTLFLLATMNSMLHFLIEYFSELKKIINFFSTQFKKYSNLLELVTARFL